MKIFRFLFVIVCFFSFVSAQNLKDYVVSNYEFLELDPDKIQYLQEYQSNKNQSYYMVDQVYYYIINSVDELKYMFRIGKLKKDRVLFLLSKSGNVLVIDLQEMIFDPSKCNVLNSNQFKLFNSFSEKKEISNIIDNVLGTTLCYRYNKNIFIALDYSSSIDLEYIFNNSKKIVDEISTLGKSDDDTNKRLKKIYKYVQEKTSYNYNVLDNVEMYKKNPTPWLVSTFFQGGKIVCDGYVKTTIFIMNYFGMNAERVVGKFQPAEKGFDNQKGFLHSWIRLGDFYYDPTFDDSDDDVSYDYFGKSQTCFSLNHYISGWVLLANSTIRYDFVKNNSKHLIYNCPLILKNVLFQDDKIIDFIKFSLNKNDLDLNKTFFCETLKFCDLDIEDKQTLLERIKQYKLTFSSNEKIHTYILSSELVDYKIEEEVIKKNDFNTSNYILNQEQVEYLDKVMKILIDKLSKYPYDKRMQYVKLIQSKIDTALKKDFISNEKRVILEYFDSLFVIEKFK